MYDATQFWQSKRVMGSLRASKFNPNDIVFVECSITRYLHKDDRSRLVNVPSTHSQNWNVVPYRIGFELTSICLVHSAPVAKGNADGEDVKI